MSFYSDTETDRRLARLEAQISKEYSIAAAEMKQKADDYFDRLNNKRYWEQFDAYQEGKYTKQEFDAWYKTQVQRGEGYRDMVDKLCERAVNANQVAASLINDATPGIWSLNYNYEAYRINQAYGIDFQLFDEMTIKSLLMEDNHVTFKHNWVNIDPKKAYNWNEKQINSSLTSAILQGKTIDQLADSYLKTMGRNESAAIRNARTSVTSAQNAGRMESYDRAKKMGINLEKEWMSTLDSRTRESHKWMDGERKPNDDEFSNGLMYPGDPDGDPAEVYNCRCTMRAILPDVNDKRTEARAYKGAEGRREYDSKGNVKAIAGYTYTGNNNGKSFKDWMNARVSITPNAPVSNQNNILRLYSSMLSRKLGDDFYDGMHDLIDKCQNAELAKVWEKYEQSISVGSTNTKGAFCRVSTIHVDKATDAKGSSWEAPYAVTFHESGHAIDSLAAKKGSGFGFHFSTSYEKGKFGNTIRNEVDNWVSAVDKQLKADFKANKNDPDWLLNNGFVSQYNYDTFKKTGQWLSYAPPKYSKSQAYAKIQSEIRALPGIERGDLSDMLEGATKGKIQCGYGHGKSYWNHNETLATEAFAEMTSASMTNPASLATIQKYLPESYKVYNEMLAELLK